ncbi:MAG: DUF6758 family protein [Nocardioides sp.]
MSLLPQCPRCGLPLGVERAVACPDHASVPPLWRTDGGGYDDFVAHLARAGSLPSLAPFPLGPEWAIADFGVVGHQGAPRGSYVACGAVTETDGPVDVVVVAEEPGIGLGARIAGLGGRDVGADLLRGPATTRLQVDRHTVSMWALPPVERLGPDAASALGIGVLVGEADGRWLWFITRPATAILMRPEWSLADLGQMGPALLDLSFEGMRWSW